MSPSQWAVERYTVCVATASDSFSVCVADRRQKRQFFYRNASLRSTWLLLTEKTPVTPLGYRFPACLSLTLFGMCTLPGIGEIRHSSSPSIRVTAPSPSPLCLQMFRCYFRVGTGLRGFGDWRRLSAGELYEVLS
ncbi:hypothetical protein TGARI_271037 [Toxoplasma gondii ARI]|uniref:Uncharacterized protein n=1 Tax=Toxoplasma gondii ARI TaxID=1074872 RepID=A0A139Y6Q2_TOXGO|nr:hypothetical protein TGARI_271037 [Toxoplasma gondii ARI]